MNFQSPEKFSFNIGGFMGPSYSVVLENGSLIYRAYESGYVLSEEDRLITSRLKWNNFMQKMDELDVWAWEKEHLPELMIDDGTGWELVIKGENRKIETSGINAYPDQFDVFLKSVWNLIGRRKIG